jgi:hypothetical protein
MLARSVAGSLFNDVVIIGSACASSSQSKYSDSQLKQTRCSTSRDEEGLDEIFYFESSQRSLFSYCYKDSPETPLKFFC